eukprot:5207780-Amphidinium_carterae.1
MRADTPKLPASRGSRCCRGGSLLEDPEKGGSQSEMGSEGHAMHAMNASFFQDLNLKLLLPF